MLRLKRNSPHLHFAMNTFKFMEAYLFSPIFRINGSVEDEYDLPQIRFYNQLKSEFWSSFEKDSISDVVISDVNLKSYFSSVDLVAKSFICSDLVTVKSKLLQTFDGLSARDLDVIIEDYLFESTKFFNNAKEHYKDYPKILDELTRITTWKQNV